MFPKVYLLIRWQVPSVSVKICYLFGNIPKCWIDQAAKLYIVRVCFNDNYINNKSISRQYNFSSLTQKWLSAVSRNIISHYQCKTTRLYPGVQHRSSSSQIHTTDPPAAHSSTKLCLHLLQTPHIFRYRSSPHCTISTTYIRTHTRTRAESRGRWAGPPPAPAPRVSPLPRDRESAVGDFRGRACVARLLPPLFVGSLRVSYYWYDVLTCSASCARVRFRWIIRPASDV